jgi:hypothetical protein
MGRNENKRNQLILHKFEEQKSRVQQKLKEYGLRANL